MFLNVRIQTISLGKGGDMRAASTSMVLNMQHVFPRILKVYQSTEPRGGSESKPEVQWFSIHTALFKNS